MIVRRYLLISDTHVPDRVPEVPRSFLEYLATRLPELDLVIHLGDFTSLETYKLFKSLAKEKLLAVLGNMDDYELYKLLKKIEIVEPFDKFRILCFHSDIVPRGFHPAIAEVGKKFASKTVFFGHTHKPEALQYQGLVLVNPGSLTNGDIRGYPNTFAEVEIVKNESKFTIRVEHKYTATLETYSLATFVLQ